MAKSSFERMQKRLRSHQKRHKGEPKNRRERKQYTPKLKWEATSEEWQRYYSRRERQRRARDAALKEHLWNGKVRSVGGHPQKQKQKRKKRKSWKNKNKRRNWRRKRSRR